MQRVGSSGLPRCRVRASAVEVGKFAQALEQALPVGADQVGEGGHAAVPSAFGLKRLPGSGMTTSSGAHPGPLPGKRTWHSVIRSFSAARTCTGSPPSRTSQPRRAHPDLARSLSNLGAWFSALGRPAEALPAEREAVEADRELESRNHPMAVTGIAVLEQLGQAEALRKRLHHILTEGNEDPNAFRATSRYVVAFLKRHGGRTQEG